MKIQDLFEENNDIFSDLKKSDVPDKLYHGTSTQLGLNIGDTIKPPNQTEKLSELGRKKNLDKVFLTPNFKYAKIYAGRSVRQFGGEPVVYEIKPVGPELFRQESGDTIWTCDHGYIVDQFGANELYKGKKPKR